MQVHGSRISDGKDFQSCSTIALAAIWRCGLHRDMSNFDNKKRAS
jgi:hypothetical protein